MRAFATIDVSRSLATTTLDESAQGIELPQNGPFELQVHVVAS
jgi:hypothetical protein